MKSIQSIILLVFGLLCYTSVSAQYGNGYNNGYGGGSGYGNGRGMGGMGTAGMDRSLMQAQQTNPKKQKETPAEEIAAQLVEQMKPEVKLDELQAIAITNVLADSMKEQGVLLKNESSSQEKKIEQINALREVTNKKITAFLNPDQVEKYTNFMDNLKDDKKSKSKKKKKSKESKEDTEAIKEKE
ncbi:hypothetical protein [Flavobacterium hercynium]|uniref:DUF4168 domain-containing protein n=1 Tax=Flavobacterium hercynium TaxID=387094 RepID=A0A226GTI4_9FLAO|nr:hypothetical protein [Flavobacterium hercynium]OXA85352.1 hypothetical protein B0A66_19800 [Flavobacterium hercynium]SMP36831.1 hypothetical protein SAMN06265346_12435 [Flavobacterium hercynium]